MFNLFKRKRGFDTEAQATFTDAVSQMLLLQQAGAGTTRIEDDRGNVNRQALGYIFGFVLLASPNSGVTINTHDVLHIV
jgi:hypothetical protein